MNQNNKCSICNSNNMIQMTDDKNIYGLVSITEGNVVNVNKILPVHAFCCKDCGHIELVHIMPSAIQKK